MPGDAYFIELQTSRSFQMSEAHFCSWRGEMLENDGLGCSQATSTGLELVELAPECLVSGASLLREGCSDVIR